MAKLDDDRQAERAAILRRRAQLAACAVAAGVALPHCSGRTCLEPPFSGGAGGSAAAGAGGTTSGAGGAAVPCLSTGGSISIGGSAEGGQAFCLTIADSAGAGGADGGQAGTGGVAICLSVK